MDEIFKPLLSGTTPRPPKFNVNVTWSALALMDETNQTPNITFGNTRAETLRFWGAGVQHSACCRVWIFCPSTVSLSDELYPWTSRRLHPNHSCQFRLWSQIIIMVEICVFSKRHTMPRDHNQNVGSLPPSEVWLRDVHLRQRPVTAHLTKSQQAMAIQF